MRAEQAQSHTWPLPPIEREFSKCDSSNAIPPWDAADFLSRRIRVIRSSSCSATTGCHH